MTSMKWKVDVVVSNKAAEARSKAPEWFNDVNDDIWGLWTMLESQDVRLEMAGVLVL